MEPTATGFDEDPFPLGELAWSLPDPVAVIGPDGRIVWANAALGAFLGVPAADLVGREALSLVAPEELDRAVSGIEYATTYPDQTALVAYCVQRPDGRQVPVEITSSVLAHPDGDHLVLVVRDATSRTVLADALRTVIEGRPFERTAQLVTEAAAHRWPQGAALVTWVEAGRRRSAVAGLTDQQAQALRLCSDNGSATREGSDELGPGPWSEPPEEGRCEVYPIDGLPGRCVEALRHSGIGALAVIRIPAPDGAPAALVGLFDSEQVAQLEFVHAAEEYVEVCQIALAHRHNLDRLDHAARHDQLTGLPNRRQFLEAMRAALDAGERIGVLFVDLDGFKAVNDRWGHRTGDRLLAAAAHRLAGVDGATLVARLGGDEFGLLRRQPVDRLTVAVLAERIVAALTTPIGLDDQLPEVRVRLGASVGATVGEPGTPHGRILEAADQAMYEAKAAGGGWRWSSLVR